MAMVAATAMVMTYLALLLLFAFPIGVERYLAGDQRFTDSQLAAFTVTSPFSAALNVPMHTTRADMAGLNAQPLKVADTVLVNVAGLRLPVWLIFLMIYPPFCLAGFGLTCLVFRFRWWRAGVQG